MQVLQVLHDGCISPSENGRGWGRRANAVRTALVLVVPQPMRVDALVVFLEGAAPLGLGC